MLQACSLASLHGSAARMALPPAARACDFLASAGLQVPTRQLLIQDGGTSDRRNRAASVPALPFQRAQATRNAPQASAASAQAAASTPGSCTGLHALSCPQPRGPFLACRPDFAHHPAPVGTFMCISFFGYKIHVLLNFAQISLLSLQHKSSVLAPPCGSTRPPLRNPAKTLCRTPYMLPATTPRRRTLRALATSAASAPRGLRSRPQRARRASNSAGGNALSARPCSCGGRGSASSTAPAPTSNSSRSPHAASAPLASLRLAEYDWQWKGAHSRSCI